MISGGWLDLNCECDSWHYEDKFHYSCSVSWGDEWKMSLSFHSLPFAYSWTQYAVNYTWADYY